MSSRLLPTLLVLLTLFSAGQARAQFGLERLDLGKASKIIDSAKDVKAIAKGVAGIGPEEERVIGGSVAVEIVGRYGGVLRDEPALSRVNLVGKTLASFSDKPGLDWRFGVLDSQSVNAFSAPSGYVFITRGLYEVCGDNDDLLAAVLAHEIVHITERHALKIVSRGEFLSGASSLASKNSSQYREVDGQLHQFDLGIDQITTTLFEKGFDPKTEYAADGKGRALAITAGFAPDGLRRVLNELKQRSNESEPVFSSHPSVKDRLSRLP